MTTPTDAGKEPKTYTGNCHCGAFKFKLTVPEIDSAMGCNCSICARKGMLYVFPGKKEAITVERGLDGLKEYTFDKGNLRHMVS